jgi:hypothetical protein
MAASVRTLVTLDALVITPTITRLLQNVVENPGVVTDAAEALFPTVAPSLAKVVVVQQPPPLDGAPGPAPVIGI